MTHEFAPRLRVNGRPFICDEGMIPHVRQIFAGCYDIPGDWAPTNPVVLDIGANVGSFAVWAANRWPGCFVHCYEPHPETVKALLDNTEHLGFRRIEVDDVAVVIGEPPHGSFCIRDGASNSGEAELTIGDGAPVYTMHASLLPPADIIKVDIEGNEPGVLRNYPHWDRVRAVMYEFHGPHDRVTLDQHMQWRGFTLVGGRVFAHCLGEMKWLRTEYVSAVTGVPAGTEP